MVSTFINFFGWQKNSAIFKRVLNTRKYKIRFNKISKLRGQVSGKGSSKTAEDCQAQLRSLITLNCPDYWIGIVINLVFDVSQPSAV